MKIFMENNFNIDVNILDIYWNIYYYMWKKKSKYLVGNIWKYAWKRILIFMRNIYDIYGNIHLYMWKENMRKYLVGNIWKYVWKIILILMWNIWKHFKSYRKYEAISIPLTPYKFRGKSHRIPTGFKLIFYKFEIW